MAPVRKIVLGSMEIGRRMDLEAGAKFVQLFQSYGHTEIDTAYMYAGGVAGGENGGDTERLLGKMESIVGSNIATKANPGDSKTLSGTSIRHQLETSLKNLNADSCDMFYLHWPCMDVPLTETLETVNTLYNEGKFKRFGLSNYTSWQVAEVQGICREKGYIRPSVYQGMYNCLTRMVEQELFSCLKRYKMSFYVYNPLAGGMLTGKHKVDDHPEEKTDMSGRFYDNDWGKAYRARFWRDSYFAALDLIRKSCEAEGIEMTGAALRWILHHSPLSEESGDALIVGSSNINNLQKNLEYCQQGPLPNSVVLAIDQANELTRGNNPLYFRNVSTSFALAFVK